MEETFSFVSPALRFAALFEPRSFLTPEGREPDAKFRLTVYLPDDTEDFPDWVLAHTKTASWVRAAPGRILNLSSLFRVPIFGISGDWLATVRQRNFDPDRLLSDVSARVHLGLVLGNSGSANRRQYCNLLAVELFGNPRIPTLEEHVGLIMEISQ